MRQTTLQTLKNSVFPYSKRPLQKDFLILMHYPNQLLTSLGSIKYQWPEHLTNNTYEVKFIVQKVEAIRQNWMASDSPVPRLDLPKD